MARSPERRRLLQLWAAIVVALPASASAHPGPAVAPHFGTPDCITVVDTRTTPMLTLQYAVEYDDVESEPDKITLADSKTHQFFAFRGQVQPYLPDYHFMPFDPAAQPYITLPLWISTDDLTRAAAANNPTIAPDFSADAIGRDVLLERSDLSETWSAIAGSKRVPITEQQSRFGLQWDMTTLAAGVYQVVGYIFSPPYNAWEARPGVIKVVDGSRDVPAVTVDPVDASLYAGQGRRISGCVHAAAGTTLHASYRSAADPSAPWQAWNSQEIGSDGRFEMCFQSPDPSFAGLVQIRVSARAPTGDETVAYAPDQLAVVATAAPCAENNKICCPAPAASMPAPQPSAGGPALGAAGSGSRELAVAMAPPPTSKSTAAGGCIVSGTAATSEAAAFWLLLLGYTWHRKRRS